MIRAILFAKRNMNPFRCESETGLDNSNTACSCHIHRRRLHIGAWAQSPQYFSRYWGESIVSTQYFLALHRLMQVCFTATCKLFGVCATFLPDLEYRQYLLSSLGRGVLEAPKTYIRRWPGLGPGPRWGSLQRFPRPPSRLVRWLTQTSPGEKTLNLQMDDFHG